MGLTIHYSGIFRDDTLLKNMIDEVIDISRVYDWKYTVFNEQFPISVNPDENQKNELYGVLFTPTGSEPVHLTFLSNKRMCSIIGLHACGSSYDEKAIEYLYLLSTKTQFAGIDTHRIIVHILKYISKKYLTNFRVLDEGKYWETGDEKLLNEIFSRYEAAFEIFDNALHNNPLRENETFEEYFARLLRQLGKQ